MRRASKPRRIARPMDGFANWWAKHGYGGANFIDSRDAAASAWRAAVLRERRRPK